MSKSKPVPITEIGWVPLYANGKGAMLTAHVTREYVEEEFDEKFGAGKWTLELTPLSGAMKARVTNMKDGSFREGVGISSDFKTKAIDVKASSTDAIKRCGTNWGVARGLSWFMWWPWVEQNKYGKYEPCEPPNTKGFEKMPQTGAGKIDFYSRFLKQFFGIKELSGYGTINANNPTHGVEEESQQNDGVEYLKKTWNLAQEKGDDSIKFKKDWAAVALKAVEKAEGDLEVIEQVYDLVVKNLSAKSKTAKHIQSLLA